MMMTFEVKTGFGYFKKYDGKIIDRARLPIGIHNRRPGYTYYEVADQNEYDAIEIWQDLELAKEQADRVKVAEKIESMAVAELKKNNHVFESVKFKDK